MTITITIQCVIKKWFILSKIGPNQIIWLKIIYTIKNGQLMLKIGQLMLNFGQLIINIGQSMLN